MAWLINQEMNNMKNTMTILEGKQTIPIEHTVDVFWNSQKFYNEVEEWGYDNKGGGNRS